MPSSYHKLFKRYKQKSLNGRYITNTDIEPFISQITDNLKNAVIGYSVQDRPIYGIKIGQGPIRVMMWSQMHGNESTTTKAVMDVIHTVTSEHDVFNNLSLFIIPILNPDGAKQYTRVNANLIDLNRDASALTQPESKLLRKAFDDFKPNFCFNLHDQRTIFGLEGSNQSATVSFLAPAYNKALSINKTRAKAMSLIAVMNESLQQVIPGKIGLYDDAFNTNCVGDTFQQFKVPTVLFEAGHFNGDYAREETRYYIYIALLKALESVEGILNATTDRIDDYKSLPKNIKNYVDVKISNAVVDGNVLDIGILFHEVLEAKVVKFIPKVDVLSNEKLFLGHRTINANNKVVTHANADTIKIGMALEDLKIDGTRINLNV